MEIKQTVISDHSTVLYVYLSLGGVDFDFSHRLAVSWKSDRNSVRAAVRRGWLVIKGERARVGGTLLAINFHIVSIYCLASCYS